MTSPLRLGAAFACGLVFGLGLAVSGMLDPSRVRSFLDVTGTWDPSLAFVLGGAVIASLIGVAISRRMRAPVLAAAFDLPRGRTIDGRLILGSAIFGVGWGLAGLCPGPAIASVSLGLGKTLAFCAAMFAGMAIFARTAGRQSEPRTGATPPPEGVAGRL